MRKICCLVTLCFATALFSAPLPSKRPPKKDPAEFLYGQWMMTWGNMEGVVILHTDGRLVGDWPECGCNTWVGKWSYKEGVLSVWEHSATSRDEKYDHREHNLFWKTRFLQVEENSWEGWLEIGKSPANSKIKITRAGGKL